MFIILFYYIAVEFNVRCGLQESDYRLVGRIKVIVSFIKRHSLNTPRGTSTLTVSLHSCFDAL